MSQLSIVDLNFWDVEFPGSTKVQGGEGLSILFGGISPLSSFVSSANTSNTSGYFAAYSVDRNGFTATVSANVAGGIAGGVAGAVSDGSKFTSVFTTAFSS